MGLALAQRSEMIMSETATKVWYTTQAEAFAAEVRTKANGSYRAHGTGERNGREAWYVVMAHFPYCAKPGCFNRRECGEWCSADCERGHKQSIAEAVAHGTDVCWEEWPDGSRTRLSFNIRVL